MKLNLSFEISRFNTPKMSFSLPILDDPHELFPEPARGPRHRPDPIVFDGHRRVRYTIGSWAGSDLRIRRRHHPEFHAEVNYERGDWVLKNREPDHPILVNGTLPKHPVPLQKGDVLTIGGKRYHWSNYFSEGDRQDLSRRDVFSLHGRVSRANFRIMHILFIGLFISVFFMPGLLASWLDYQPPRVSTDPPDYFQFQKAFPILHSVGFWILGLLFVHIAVKRMRDTGRPLWMLLIPGYNILLLYFQRSQP